MTFQQFAQFVLEGNGAMVFFLSREVGFRGVDLRIADGENSVAALPCPAHSMPRALKQCPRSNSFAGLPSLDDETMTKIEDAVYHWLGLN
jgi:hypothetical protein